MSLGVSLPFIFIETASFMLADIFSTTVNTSSFFLIVWVDAQE